MATFRSFIGGQWLDSVSGRTAPNINPAELAAWTTVASTILNLDETITKE